MMTLFDKKFESDPRFSSCGALAPKSYADLMFLEHIAYHLDDDGRAAVLLPHGVLFRGKKEEAIRRYLIENKNVIDAIIGLPANCFHGTSIPVCCIVLKKNRNYSRVLHSPEKKQKRQRRQYLVL